MSLDEQSQFPEVDFTGKVDFTKGFASYHIRWPVKEEFFTKTVRSNDFNTAIGTTIMTWSSGINKRNNGSVWFGIYPKKLPGPTGIICRFALCNNNNDPIFNDLRFHIYRDGFGFGAVLSPEGVATVVGNNLVCHCWMEIPIAVTVVPIAVQARKRKFCDDDCLRGSSDLSTDVSELINGVLNVELSTDSLSDVTLNILGDNSDILRQFKCHRVILAARSPVFKTMFGNNQWKEAADNNRSVEIKDIGQSIMEYVLRFIYTGYPFPKDDVNKNILDCDGLLAIIDAAEKYMIPKLKDFCSAHLIRYACSDDDRLKQFLIADRYQLAQLKAVCEASLISDPDGIGSVDKIPNDLLIELFKAMAKRNMNLNEISVTGGE